MRAPGSFLGARIAFLLTHGEGAGERYDVTLVLLGALLFVSPQGAPGRPPWTPRPLSPFDVAKAEWLIRNRLPCLGCHELGGQGGRIGPSLSELKGQRTPDHVYSMIQDPQGTVPGTIMPRVPMSPTTLELIAGDLLQREPTPPALRRAPPAAAVGRPDTSHAAATAALYAKFCSPCHGTSGEGNGYNAAFLPVRPTAHADKQYMSRRSDDALFDAIYAGGYIMNRSNRMPPFGHTLTREQIWSLVRFLRALCRCEGPTWSRDNR
jgi:mono/diheme cytochrome c family protein